MHYTVMLVAAAGSSTRMGQPKQHILLQDKPVLLHTLLHLQSVPEIDELLLIARSEDTAFFAELAARYNITKLRTVVEGGNSRQQSVANGLAALPAQTTLVGIHDGARPFVSREAVSSVIQTAAQTGAAALALPLRDTVKEADEQGRILRTHDRNRLWRAQTPQVFDSQRLQQEMQRAIACGQDFTDECQLMEQAGVPVQLVPGSEANLKLTTPEDIRVANALLLSEKKEVPAMRIGHGYDVHRLVEGRPLILGGITIPWEKGLLGHSDADVLTHAVMDALLGAAALGDIGGLFPDTDPAYAGADSLLLLQKVMQTVRTAGYTLSNLDVTVLAQQPKLKPHIPAMREKLATACEVDLSRISIKATTEEGLGFTGAEDGIAAHAVCLLTTV